MALTASSRRKGEREFHMSDGEFREVAKIIYAQAGIVLGDHKKELVYSRLARRIRELGLADFKSYMLRLNGNNQNEERSHLINALTTNHTHFFREIHHFEYIQKTVVPKWIARAEKSGSKQLKFWSAASSSGEEPYTLAMTVAHALEGHSGWDWKMLATDIDTKVLQQARLGHYKAETAKGIPPAIRSKYVSPVKGQPDMINIKDSLKPNITFNQLNLHGDWPMKGQFDLIFCRNVTIYFDAESKNRLVARFRDYLKPDGVLFLGHSESVLGEKAKYHSVGRTIYTLGGDV